MPNKRVFLSEKLRKKTRMRRITICIIFLIITFSAFPQDSRTEYIQKYQLLAIKEMSRSGIPASIKMAQACLESANGKSELARKSNNHFGIKCKNDWRGQKIYYDDDRKNECFRKYRSIEDSYIDHTNFLMLNSRYAFLFELPRDDYKGWARGLKKAGYATARYYDRQLIDIIEKYKLYRLDHKETFQQLYAFEQKQISNPAMSDKLNINPFKAHKIITINGLEAVIAQKGDTYEIIAQELGIEAWELYKFNDLPEGYVPGTNEVIYLELKKRSSSRGHPTHTVDRGETMHYISQLYGIRLRPLYRRNHIDIQQQPNVGDIIYLRKRKPKI
jgi:LysM repeat protein